MHRKGADTESVSLNLKQMGSSVLSILNKLIHVGSFHKSDVPPTKLKDIIKQR